MHGSFEDLFKDATCVLFGKWLNPYAKIKNIRGYKSFNNK